MSELSYPVQNISLAHPTMRQSPGSVAHESMSSLQEADYRMILNPSTQSGCVKQYIQNQFETADIRRMPMTSQPRRSYELWRSEQPERQLFLAVNHSGKLALASWVEPLDAPSNGSRKLVEAAGGIQVFDADIESAQHFLRLTHAIVFQQYAFASHGIVVGTTFMPLLPAAKKAGYRHQSDTTDPDSGIVTINMVVSSESLKRSVQAPLPKRLSHLPSPPIGSRPRLRLLRGGKDDK